MMKLNLSPLQLIRSFPIMSYVALSCLLTWLLVLPGFFGLGLDVLWDQMDRWPLLGAAGPVLAVVVVLGTLEGRQAIGQLLARLIKWRVEPSWAVFALLTPLFMLGAALAIAELLGHSTQEQLNGHGLDSTVWTYWIPISLVATLFYAISEEIGWRGFVLDRLQNRYSCFTATAIVAALWALWHLPFFIVQAQSYPAQLIGLLSTLFAESVFLSYLYNSTRGSLFLVVIWHTHWNMLALLVALLSSTIASLLSAVLMLTATGLLFALDTKRPVSRNPSAGI